MHGESRKMMRRQPSAASLRPLREMQVLVGLGGRDFVLSSGENTMSPGGADPLRAAAGMYERTKA
jgi:hypothetical protein